MSANPCCHEVSCDGSEIREIGGWADFCGPILAAVPTPIRVIPTLVPTGNRVGAVSWLCSYGGSGWGIQAVL